MRRMLFLGGLLCLSLGMRAQAEAPSASAAANGLQTLTMCLFDFVGQDGPVHKTMKDMLPDFMRWGVNLEFNLFTDDRVASEVFKNDGCDMLNLPGLRAREYNRFTGSINAIGAIPTYEHLKMVLASLTSAKSARYMQSGDYEVIGISPIGAIFLYVNDRRIVKPLDMAGKRITVLENAPETAYLAKELGLTPVSSSILNALQKFNNKAVDITGSPGVAYEPLELYRGLEPDGGIIEWPTIQVTMQLLIRRDKLPNPEFAQNVRELIFSKYDYEIKKIVEAEERIPQKYRIKINDDAKNAWNDLFRKSRIALSQQGIYERKALTLFRAVRCRFDPVLAECSAQDRE